MPAEREGSTNLDHIWSKTFRMIIWLFNFASVGMQLFCWKSNSIVWSNNEIHDIKKTTDSVSPLRNATSPLVTLTQNLRWSSDHRWHGRDASALWSLCMLGPLFGRCKMRYKIFMLRWNKTNKRKPGSRAAAGDDNEVSPLPTVCACRSVRLAPSPS